MSTTEWHRELRQAISAAGGSSKVAAALGVGRTTVQMWLELDELGQPTRRVPSDRCLALERLLNRPGLAQLLRPDVFAPRDDLAPLPEPAERAA